MYRCLSSFVGIVLILMCLATLDFNEYWIVWVCDLTIGFFGFLFILIGILWKH